MDPYRMQNLSRLAPKAGQMLGGAIGTAVAGPLGAVAGKKIGKQVGQVAGQLVGQRAASKLKQQSESLFPQYEDPRQLAQLARLQQMQKSLETGAEFQGAKDTAMQNVAGTQAGIVRSTGGDVGSTIQGLLQSQRVGGQQVNQAYAQAGERQAALNPLVTSLNNLVSSRKMELQLAQSQQKLAEWAKMQQQLNQNLGAGLAREEAMSRLNQDNQNTEMAKKIGGGFNFKDLLSKSNQGGKESGKSALQGAMSGIEEMGGGFDFGTE